MQILKCNKTNRIVISGLLLAIGVVVPLMFHLIGLNGAGQIFLPMHIPVILAGLLVGRLYGLAVGIICPLISCLIIGMPSPARLPFMIIELAVYGLVSAIAFENIKIKKTYPRIIISLLIAMVSGRLAYAAALFIAGNIFGLGVGGPIIAWSATVMGIPGIIIQLVIIPIMATTLAKAYRC